MMGYSIGGNEVWAFHGLWMLVIAIVVVIPVWRLCQRLGYPGWMGILILVPMVNLILLYVIAFGEWPRNRDNGGSS